MAPGGAAAPARPEGSRLEIAVAGDLGPLADEWAGLASRNGNLFGTWEWASVWWRYLGKGRLRIGTVRDAEQGLVAIWPFYRVARGPLRMLRLLGHGPGDELGPVCPPDRLATALQALPAVLRAAGTWDIVIAENLPADRDWAGLPGGALVVHRDSSPVLQAGGMNWTDFLRAASPNFRQQARRYDRLAEARHRIEYRLTGVDDDVDAAMSTLIRLHRARWQGGGAFEGALAGLHREFARTAQRRGWLRLWTLYVDAEPAAATLGYRFAGDEWYYNGGRDPRFDRLRVGDLVLRHSVREALNDGVGAYRFLRGGESYKRRYAPDDPGLMTVAIGRGPLGRAAAALAGWAGTVGSPALRHAARALAGG